MRLSQLDKMEIVGESGEKKGNVKGVLLDVEEGRIIKFSYSDKKTISFSEVKKIEDKIFV